MSEKLNQDESINENWLSEQIAEKEGKTDEQDIAEIKEMLKITLDLLSEIREEDSDLIEGLLDKHSSE